MTANNHARRAYDRLQQVKVSDKSLAITFLQDKSTERAYRRTDLFSLTEQIGKRLDVSLRELDSKGSNGIVAILFTSQEEQVLHELAALSCGYVPAILTPHNRKLDRTRFLKAMAEVLAKVAPLAVITDMGDELADIVGRTPVGGAPAVLSPRTCEIRHRGKASVRPLDSNTAYVQFSSGTTGIKKAVEVSYDALDLQLQAYGKALALEPTVIDNLGNVAGGDVIVGWLPLYHDMGFFTSMHLALAYGVHSVLLNPLDWVVEPAKYLRAVDHFRATLGWHPNFAYSFMAKRIRDDEISNVNLSCLRGFVNCSEPVTFTSQQGFADRFAAFGFSDKVFMGCYAMAETTFAVTHGNGSQQDGLDLEPLDESSLLPSADVRVSVGTPIDGVSIVIRDNDGNSLSQRQIGEICISAPFLANGYLDSEATKAAFVDGEYRSGDLGYYDGERLYVCGRKKDMLIVAGNNLFPEDIETIVGRANGIRDGRVVAASRFDKRLQTERVIILAETEIDGQQVDLTETIDSLSAQLGLDGARIELVAPGFLIKSSSGKLSRALSLEKWAQ